MPYRFAPIHLTPDGADALTLAEHGRAAGTTRAAMAQALHLRRAAGRLSAEPRADLLRDGFTLGEILVWGAAALAEADACAPHATGEAA